MGSKYIFLNLKNYEKRPPQKKVKPVLIECKEIKVER